MIKRKQDYYCSTTIMKTCFCAAAVGLVAAGIATPAVKATPVTAQVGYGLGCLQIAADRSLVARMLNTWSLCSRTTGMLLTTLRVLDGMYYVDIYCILVCGNVFFPCMFLTRYVIHTQHTTCGTRYIVYAVCLV